MKNTFRAPLFTVALLFSALLSPLSFPETNTATRSGNWSDTTVWSLGHAPIATEDVVLGAYMITWNAAAGSRIPASGSLNSLSSPGAAGKLSLDLDDVSNASLNVITITTGTATTGMVIVQGSSGSLTINANIAASNCNGVYITATTTNSVITINGSLEACTASTKSPIWNHSTACVNVNISGTATAGSGTARYIITNVSTGTINGTGNLTGGSGGTASGLFCTGAGVVNWSNGDLTGGSATSCPAINNITGTTTLTDCNVISGAGSMGFVGKPPTIIDSTSNNYWQTDPSGAKYGPQPLDHQLLSGVNCGSITGNRTDAVASDVWYGVTYGDPDAPTVGTKRASSIANLTAENIKSGIVVDDVTGTNAGETHTSNQVISSAGGNYVEPDASDVWNGVPFGLTVGTKRASSIANLTAGNIRKGVVVDNVTGTYLSPKGFKNPYLRGGK